jgi:peptide chain release factor subunit 3
VGRATLETPTKRYTIFDAPGHKNYVPDMIMGAAMADTAALVISARKGEYEAGFERDGQTREHAQLAKSLGVERLIVIVNKMDEDSVKWSKDRFDEIKSGVLPFLTDQCGFDGEKILFVPISGLSGENIDSIGPNSPWYEGPPLLTALDEMELPERDPNGPLRIPVLDKMKDRGVVAFGKVESGTVKVGTKLSVMPNDIHCQVTAIINCKQEYVRYATPGENIQIKVRMIDDENLINKGDVLCPYDALAPITEEFLAELQILELLPHRQIMTPGYKSMMHLHTVGDEIVVNALRGVYESDGAGKEYLKKNPKYAKSGSKLMVTIKTRVPVCLEKYEFIEHMGRFTLRDEGKTIALGKVLKYKPAVIKKEDDADEKERLLQQHKEKEQQKLVKLEERKEEEGKQTSASGSTKPE